MWASDPERPSVGQIHHPMSDFTTTTIQDRWGFGKFVAMFCSIGTGPRGIEGNWQNLGTWKPFTLYRADDPEYESAAQGHMAVPVDRNAGDAMERGLTLLAGLKGVAHEDAEKSIQSARLAFESQMNMTQNFTQTMMAMQAQQTAAAQQQQNQLLALVMGMRQAPAEDPRVKMLEEKLAKLEAELEEEPELDEEEEAELRMKNLMRDYKKRGAAAVMDHLKDVAVEKFFDELPRLAEAFPAMAAQFAPMMKNMMLQAVQSAVPRPAPPPPPQPVIHPYVPPQVQAAPPRPSAPRAPRAPRVPRVKETPPEVKKETVEEVAPRVPRVKETPPEVKKETAEEVAP
jgi:hypothetical protein